MIHNRTPAVNSHERILHQSFRRILHTPKHMFPFIADPTTLTATSQFYKLPAHIPIRHERSTTNAVILRRSCIVKYPPLLNTPSTYTVSLIGQNSSFTLISLYRHSVSQSMMIILFRESTFIIPQIYLSNTWLHKLPGPWFSSRSILYFYKLIFYIFWQYYAECIIFHILHSIHSIFHLFDSIHHHYSMFKICLSIYVAPSMNWLALMTILSISIRSTFYLSYIIFPYYSGSIILNKLNIFHPAYLSNILLTYTLINT